MRSAIVALCLGWLCAVGAWAAEADGRTLGPAQDGAVQADLRVDLDVQGLSMDGQALVGARHAVAAGTHELGIELKKPTAEWLDYLKVMGDRGYELSANGRKFVLVKKPEDGSKAKKKIKVDKKITRFTVESVTIKAEFEGGKRRYLSTLLAEQGKKQPSNSWSSLVKYFLVTTNLGEIVLELDTEKAPLTCANFESYVQKGHYNGTVFHRVISNFMIQGGGMDSLMAERPTDKPIENEAGNGLKNERGTIAMARTNAVHSATSQFFINVVDNDFLNHRSPDPQGFGYCVFGRVVKGMEAVDAIKAVPTGSKGAYRDVPVQPVVIQSITLQP